MKLIDGIFKYGETVAIDMDGRLIKRKVHYADGELFIDVKGQRIKENDLSGIKRFDQDAYVADYHRKNNERVSLLLKKGTKDIWKAAAGDHGMSMNAFIIHCVEKEINK